MNYLLVENLAKSYGEKQLFRNITFGLNRGQKVAMIGRNGTGKTTLLNIIMGRDIPEEGRVVIRKDIKVSYLPQNPELNEQLTVLEVLLSSQNDFFKAISAYENALHRINIDDSEDNRAILEKAMAEMDAKSAWDYENKIKEILSRLRIEDINQRVGELSGGQRRKVALARALIEEVDLLLLDEPTNHLDIDMIEWLEQLLAKQKITLLVVTHDRFFLDNVCNEIIEIENDGVYHYRGDYAYYVVKKAERLFNEQQEAAKARNLYKKELDWMRRMPKARTTKSKARIDAFYELESKARKKVEEKTPEFQVKSARIGKKILELNHIHKSFGPLKVIDDFSHTFKKGERIGVVGPNGAGKSTLFRLIMGELKPDMGSIVKGQTMVFGYFSQEGPRIKEGMRVIDIVREVADEIPFGSSSTLSAAQFLYYFNFDNSTQANYYSNLSGGEKRRLHLVLTLVHNPNFLILDEPTNDLDIPTLNILEDFLMRYQGCLMVTTHDRAFLDKIADHLFVFEGNGKIKDYHASYTEYRLKKQDEERKQKREKQLQKEKTAAPKKAKTSNKPTYKQKKEYEELNRRIDELESQKAEVLEKLNGGEGSAEDFTQWSQEFSRLENELEEAEMRWLELAEIMENKN
jgi:ATP-binding cassette subfamily F protein uup